MRPFRRGEDRGGGTAFLSALTGTRAVTEREASFSAVGSRARFSSEKFVHDPAEYAWYEVGVAVNAHIFFAFAYDVVGEDSEEAVDLVEIVSVFRDRMEQAQAERLVSLEIIIQSRFQLCKRQFLFVVNENFDGVKRIHEICHTDEARHDPIISGAAALDIKSAREAIVDKAGEQGIDGMLRAVSAEPLLRFEIAFDDQIESRQNFPQMLVEASVFLRHGVEQKLSHIGIGACNPDVGGGDGCDLHAGAVDIIVRFLFGYAVGLQTARDDVVVEDGGMGSALGKDLTSFFQKFLGHILGIAQTDGGIDESDIGDYLQTHFRQLVCHGTAVFILSSDHVAAGKTVWHAHIDLDPQTVEQKLCFLSRKRAVLHIPLIKGVEIAVGTSELELLIPLAKRPEGKHIGDEMNGLDRLVEAFRGMGGDLVADPCDLRQLGFSFGVLGPVCQTERLGGVIFAMTDHGEKAFFANEVKLFFILVTAEKKGIDSSDDSVNALGKQKLIIDRHMGVLTAARRTAGTSCDVAVFLIPLLLLGFRQEISDLADDQLTVGNVGCQSAERLRQCVRV